MKSPSFAFGIARKSIVRSLPLSPGRRRPLYQGGRAHFYVQDSTRPYRCHHQEADGPWILASQRMQREQQLQPLSLLLFWSAFSGSLNCTTRKTQVKTHRETRDGDLKSGKAGLAQSQLAPICDSSQPSFHPPLLLLSPYFPSLLPNFSIGERTFAGYSCSSVNQA